MRILNIICYQDVKWRQKFIGCALTEFGQVLHGWWLLFVEGWPSCPGPPILSHFICEGSFVGIARRHELRFQSQQSLVLFKWRRCFILLHRSRLLLWCPGFQLNCSTTATHSHSFNESPVHEVPVTKGHTVTCGLLLLRLLATNHY